MDPDTRFVQCADGIISSGDDCSDSLSRQSDAEDPQIEIHIPKSAFDSDDSSNEELRDPSDNSFAHDREYENLYIRSNSPMASNCNSDLEDDDAPREKHYKKFTCEEIESRISKYYEKDERNFAEMDIVITYLKGVRLIYAQSQSTTQTKLYSIFLLTLCLTITLSIIAPFSKNSEWGPYLLSSGNAFITVLVALTRYLRLDKNSIEYSFTSKQYDKLKTALEMNESFYEMRAKDEFTTRYPISTRESIFPPQSEQILAPNSFCASQETRSRSGGEELAMAKCVGKFSGATTLGRSSFHLLRETEQKINETREICNALVPSEIIRMFPIIYNTNIFQFIKKMEQYKNNLIIRLRDIKNEISYIRYSKQSSGFEKSQSHRSQKADNRLHFLMDMKEKTKKDLILCKNTYYQMNDIFNREIRYAETHQSCFGCSGWFRPNYDFREFNPVVRDYLNLVLPN